MSSGADERLAVHDVMHRYALAIDTKDWERLATVFAPEVKADFTSFGARHVYEGPAAGWVEQIKQTIAGMDATQHLMANHLYAVDEDRAEGTTYIQALHRCRNDWGDDVYTVGGHYEVTMQREAGQWRIRAYAIKVSWHHGNRSVLKAATRRAAAER